MKNVFKKGRYYIGDLSWVLDFGMRDEIEKISNFTSGVYTLANGLKFGLSCGEICDFRDNTGFVYINNSELFGVISAEILDEELLDDRILKVKNEFLYNKFSMEKLAKIVEFDEDFEIKFDDLIEIGNLKININ